MSQPGLHKEFLWADLTLQPQIYWGKERGTLKIWRGACQAPGTGEKKKKKEEKKTLDFQNLACKVTADVCLTANSDLLPYLHY